MRACAGRWRSRSSAGQNCRPERKRRSLREARAASALNRPNIIAVHDLANDGGTDFLMMEYVPGKPLDRLTTSKGLPPAEATGYAERIALRWPRLTQRALYIGISSQQM